MMVDPANTPLGRMLLDEITPAVMVLRTPLVEETCQKNHLSFVDMLSPFCVFNNFDVPVRTASDQPYRLKKFKLRLFYASDVRQPNAEVAKERLKQVITDAGEKDLTNMHSDPPPIQTTLASSQPEFLPSWFQFCNKELVRSVSFSDHEAFDHPVACLLVVSSRDEDPINKFVDLFNTNQLPSLLNDGVMDPKILKHFLLVHDNHDGPPERATKILAEMRSTFGLNDCRMLCINSSEDELDHSGNLWTPYKSDASPSQRLGCFLSIEDLDELKDMVQDLSSKHIIPHMEQKIRLLNQQVAATRKGFRNQIKNLWWRKGKDDTPDNPSGPMYTFNSIESQIRVLADYAFMLRDYELALSNYRLLSTDYKLDKAWKQYAGVQEMMGLTYFMLDQSRKDAEYCMENAFHAYLRIGSSGQRNATRCGLWWVEMLKARDQYKEAAGVYFRIAGEEPLHSAVMLEQASYCYLLSKPPMLRKYGFHLILSGDLYKKCDQIKHAIRTYGGALSVFKGTTWSRIRDHVHFHIGTWYATLGMFDVAIKHMLEVLACSHQSKATQELFLRDFLSIVQKMGKTFEVLRLQLPIVVIPSLKIVFEDHRTYASPTAVSVRESVWQSLEEDMIPSLSGGRSNWLEVHSKLLTKKEKGNVCVAGEQIKVEVGFKNPLQISVSVSNISLVCEHSTISDENKPGQKVFIPGADANSSTSDGNAEAVSSEISSDTSSFTLSEVHISLGGGETIVAQLTVTPKEEGALKIVGVRWKLSGSVVGFHNFEQDLVKKRVSNVRRPKQSGSSSNLKFLVIKGLPKLEGFIAHLPKTVYAGDLRHLSLELKNPSEIPVKNMKMKISHPRFLNIGSQKVMNMEFPACLKKKENSAQSDMRPTNKASDSVFLFPEDTVIHGETPFLWPLWLRAAAPGNISLDIAIYYEMGDMSTVMRYRTLRMHYSLEVYALYSKALVVNFFFFFTPEDLYRLIAKLSCHQKSFKVHQLSCVGKEWSISLLQPIDAFSPFEFLMSGQALSCCFKLKNEKKLAVTAEDKEVSSISSSIEGTDVRLSDGSSETLFDIYSSPLVDFHHFERVHQQPSDQKGNNYNFVMILMPLPSSSHWQDLHSNTCMHGIASTSPIWWVMDGPRTVHHNFSTPFIEIKLKMTLHNSSDSTSSIRIDTHDSASNPNPMNTSTSSTPSGNEVGWHDVSPLNNELKLGSDVSGTGFRKPVSPECASPFIWSGSSSTRVKLEPGSTTEVPLLICIFSPGTYDLSNYDVEWSLLSSDSNGQSSGICQGHPYYLTVLNHD
ncbi:hypothetical protein LguiB_003968 [Lonicera macranthoides]